METVENPYDKVRRKMVAARIEFMSQLAKFNQDGLKKQPTEGEWSPLELAHHLYIADGLALEELKRVQNEDNPMVVATEEEAPRLTRASEPPVSLDAVLAGMAARRASQRRPPSLAQSSEPRTETQHTGPPDRQRRGRDAGLPSVESATSRADTSAAR